MQTTLDESKLDFTRRQKLDLLRQYARIALDPSRRLDGKDRTEQTQRELDAYIAQLAREQQPPPAPVDDRDPELITADKQLAKARALFEKKQDATSWANVKACEAERERVIATIAAREKEELEQAMRDEEAARAAAAAERAARVAVASEKQNELEREAVEHFVAACACFKKIDQLGADVNALTSMRRIADKTRQTITTRSDLLLQFDTPMRLARGF